jgi:hypothetical protein
MEIKKESKVSIAAACFSMYAYKELKKQLESVDELLRPPLLKKKPKSRSVSSTFPGFPVKPVYTAQNLKSSCAMK